MKERLCIIGLDRSIANAIKQNYFGPVIVHDTVPKFLLHKGNLLIERSNGIGMLPVDKVIFHGIFEHDFDILTALTIWDGPCFPGALGMMNCRLKLPCLARALQVSKYNSKRGMIPAETSISVDQKTVGKWGNWHCGENKVLFSDTWTSHEPSIIEPYFEGEAVRVISIGNNSLQIKLEGNTWLKSIHDDRADFMELDNDLLEDTLQIKKAFQLELVANDYIYGRDGNHHLLEVNHIPNVTRFNHLKELYLLAVTDWLQKFQSC